ncbi:hypothetical protein EQG49_07885 [Periweissella cryptocerci]|uniref:Uncharacterized protein n=1 Tax=Periweissella cryptocerci TaxID=2506420 RepID=A0A4P6YUC8_9LACO|nr:hypothetical protein [Periweissella cryptocerci]QBO36389.1 hypothetical protein EQG49_07885 [Periweissella cryptocerci]
MSKRLFCLATLLVFISATLSGIAGILNPNELGMVNVEDLQNGPFTDFLILSVILTVVGIINAIVLIMVRVKPGHLAQAGIGVGAIQVALVIVQVYIFAGITLFDIMYLLLGTWQMLYGIKALHTQRLRAWWTKAVE